MSESWGGGGSYIKIIRIIIHRNELTSKCPNTDKITDKWPILKFGNTLFYSALVTNFLYVVSMVITVNYGYMKITLNQTL